VSERDDVIAISKGLRFDDAVAALRTLGEFLDLDSRYVALAATLEERASAMIELRNLLDPSTPVIVLEDECVRCNRRHGDAHARSGCQATTKLTLAHELMSKLGDDDDEQPSGQDVERSA
jgi:hypothetical protein